MATGTKARGQKSGGRNLHGRAGNMDAPQPKGGRVGTSKLSGFSVNSGQPQPRKRKTYTVK